MSEDKRVTIIPKTNPFLKQKRVAIYCRTSTRSDHQLLSLANQASQLTQLVAAKPYWRLVDIYIDVSSGKTIKERREFTRMMTDGKNDKFDMIFTKSISRFGRNTAEALKAINELREHNVKVYFEREELDTSNRQNDFIISILTSVAQEENMNRSQNISMGIIHNIENGTSSIFNRKCYGYRHNENKELEIDERKAAVVKKIFNLYLQGHSVLSITRILESEGIKSPTGKDKWSKRTVDTILSNEKYSGDVIVLKTFNEGFPETKRSINQGERKKYISIDNHAPIIAKDIFEEVKKERARRTNIIIDENGKRRKSTRYSSKKVNNTQ